MTATTDLTARAATPDWGAALCAQTDPAPFFPEGMGGRITAATQQAKRICSLCPIEIACRTWALQTRQPAGIWGGLDEHERRKALGEELSLMEVCWQRQHEIEERLAAGVSQRRISEELGVSRPTLARFISQVEMERDAVVKAA